MEKLTGSQLFQKSPASYNTGRLVSLFIGACYLQASWSRFVPNDLARLKALYSLSYVTYLRLGLVSLPSRPKARGTPLVLCLRLLSKYNCSCFPYLGGIVSYIQILPNSHGVVIRRFCYGLKTLHEQKTCQTSFSFRS